MNRLMAHWNDDRDQRWVEMMRGCDLSRTPEGADCIRKFEDSGDIIFWSHFCELLRAEGRKRTQVR